MKDALKNPVSRLVIKNVTGKEFFRQDTEEVK
jgi:hypothetical protein